MGKGKRNRARRAQLDQAAEAMLGEQRPVFVFMDPGEAPPAGYQRTDHLDADEINELCFGCHRPTDTGLGLRGPAIAHYAAFRAWGLSKRQAHMLAYEVPRHPFGREPTPDLLGPGDHYFMDYRLCAECGDKTGMVPGLLTGQPPTYEFPANTAVEIIEEKP